MQTLQDFDAIRLGPLAQLVGSWEGEKGHDITSSKAEPTETKYREAITFEPVGPIKNGSHQLYGLRYTTRAWPQGDEEPFHQELGYWLWSPEDHQIVRCFTNQNGVTIHAGGYCDTDAHHFEMTADANSDECGISSCPTLNAGRKTISYKMELDVVSTEHFTYREETHLRDSETHGEFIHTDENSMTRLY